MSKLKLSDYSFLFIQQDNTATLRPMLMDALDLTVRVGDNAKALRTVYDNDWELTAAELAPVVRHLSKTLDSVVVLVHSVTDQLETQAEKECQ